MELNFNLAYNLQILRSTMYEIKSKYKQDDWLIDCPYFEMQIIIDKMSNIEKNVLLKIRRDESVIMIKISHKKNM